MKQLPTQREVDPAAGEVWTHRDGRKRLTIRIEQILEGLHGWKHIVGHRVAPGTKRDGERVSVIYEAFHRNFRRDS